MSTVAEGCPPVDSSKDGREYLLKKLGEIRKDCQWLLGLGAASVLGVVIKENFGATAPKLRSFTLAVSALQILVSMFGAMSWWNGDVDKADVLTTLKGRLRTRYLVRNFAVLLLLASFLMIALLG